MFKLCDSTAIYNAQHTKGYAQPWEEKCSGSKGLIIDQRQRHDCCVTSELWWKIHLATKVTSSTSEDRST